MNKVVLTMKPGGVVVSLDGVELKRVHSVELLNNDAEHRMFEDDKHNTCCEIDLNDIKIIFEDGSIL